MSLQVFSDDNKVLIDSALQHLHYGGQATFTASYAGPTSFTGYTGTNSTIDGHVIYSYTYVSEGAPTIFIRPTDYTKWHALIRQEFISVTKTWQLEIIQSGSSTASPPELHIFLPSTYLPRSTETKGIQLFGDVALRGPTAEKVMTVSQVRSVEPSLTTEAAANQAAADMSTSDTPEDIAGVEVTLTGSATQPVTPALGDLWVDIGTHANGFYPKPIAPTYPTLLEVTMEERTWDGLDAYMAEQGVVMHDGTGTQVFGIEVMKYLSRLADYTWCVDNGLYSWWLSSRATLLSAVAPVVASYWDNNAATGDYILGPPQTSDGYPSYSYTLTIYGMTQNIKYAIGWAFYWTSGWDSFLQPRYDAYQIAYTQHLTNVSTANSAALATYNEELHMYAKLLAGYNAHYSSVPDVNPSYMYGKSNYGVDSAGSLIVSSPDEWLPITEGLDASIKQYLTGALNTVYPVAKPVQIAPSDAHPNVMPEGHTYAGFSYSWVSPGVTQTSSGESFPAGWTHPINPTYNSDLIIDEILFGRTRDNGFYYWFFRDDVNTSYDAYFDALASNLARWRLRCLDGQGIYDSPHIFPNLDNWSAYFGYANIEALMADPNWADNWHKTWETDARAELKALLQAHAAASTAAWAAYNGYAAELAAWEVARDAYYAALVASQAVTTDVSVSGAPSLVPEIYASFEYTYDWNVFTTVTTGAVNTHTFDSRLQPLALVSGGSIISPNTPVSAGSPTESLHPLTEGSYYEDGIQRWYWSGAPFGGGSAPGINQNDWDFKSNNHSSSHSLTAGLTQSNLMFAAPSLTQAVQVRTIRGYGEHLLYGGGFTINFTNLFGSSANFGLTGVQQLHSISTWWAMYLNAFKLENNSFKSGWVTYDAGFEYSANWTAGSVGFFPWDDDEEAGTVSYGSVPYEPKTINHKSNMYLIADVTRYA